MVDLARAAFKLALRRVAVFPLSPRSKVPLKGTRGLLDASDDADLARARWKKHPNANIGIATGRKSNLWVLDVDGADGRVSLAALEADHGALPLTVAVETPGGGLHLYWRWPSDGTEIRNSASRIAPRIDGRGEGGSVTAPPSTHPNGGRYRWAGNGASRIADAPPWLIGLAAPPSIVHREPQPFSGDLTHYCAAAIASELDGLAGAAEGQRNHELNRAAFAIAGFVRAGAAPEDWARAELERGAACIGLSTIEAQRTIESAFRAAPPRELPQ